MLSGIPRHRNGSFDPIPIAKDRRRLPEVDTRIVSLYARGMTAREFQGQIEAIHGIDGIEVYPIPISAIARGDGRGDGLAKPVAGAMLSDRLHGRDPGRYSQVSNTAGFGALAILPDGTGDVLGLRFRANEGATVWAKGFDAPRNRGVQDIPIAVVDAEAAEAAPVEDRDLGADLEAPPGGSDPGALPERRGRGEIDLYRADCDLSGVDAARAAWAGREKPARHHVRRSLPNGVTEAPAHKIQDSLRSGSARNCR